jgi:hypothetical protein
MKCRQSRLELRPISRLCASHARRTVALSTRRRPLCNAASGSLTYFFHIGNSGGSIDILKAQARAASVKAQSVGEYRSRSEWAGSTVRSTAGSLTDLARAVATGWCEPVRHPNRGHLTGRTRAPVRRFRPAPSHAGAFTTGSVGTWKRRRSGRSAGAVWPVRKGAGPVGTRPAATWRAARASR